jgi:type II secretory pathway component GspD/PulD (secretin)
LGFNWSDTLAGSSSNWLGGFGPVQQTNHWDWPGQNPTYTQNFQVNTILGPSTTIILTSSQFNVLTKAMERQAGFEMLSSPKVVTLSGRQAQISVSSIRPVVSAINPKALVFPGIKSVPGTNAVFITENVTTGPTVDVIPTVSVDGNSIELNVTFTVVEFLGYEPPKDKAAKIKVLVDGHYETVDQPRPKFRVNNLKSAARIWDGQTLLIAGPGFEEEKTTRGSWGRKKTETIKKKLVVCLTATIIDPAGNRVHAEDQLPFNPNAIPTQLPPQNNPHLQKF